jgi:hypothetical protein
MYVGYQLFLNALCMYAISYCGMVSHVGGVHPSLYLLLIVVGRYRSDVEYPCAMVVAGCAAGHLHRSLYPLVSMSWRSSTSQLGVGRLDIVRPLPTGRRRIVLQ